MPHLTVTALEGDLVGREAALIGALTDAVVAVYGDWAREQTEVRLLGLPTGRWGVGGTPVEQRSPSVSFGISDAVFARPDADRIVTELIARVTDAVAAVLGEPTRAGVTVELVGVPAGRTARGGALLP